MRFFFDTEFNENVEPVELISIGIVDDDGREFYGVNEFYTSTLDINGRASCNDWVKVNVLPLINIPEMVPDLERGDRHMVGTLKELKDGVTDFVGMMTPSIEFWAWYGHYDWYLLTRLFKSFDKLPKGWPQASFDLHQFKKHVLPSTQDLPAKFTPEHNALIDARWTKDAFEVCLNKWKSFDKRGRWP